MSANESNGMSQPQGTRPNGSQRDLAIQMRTLQNLHEDDGANEDAQKAAETLPMDAQALQALLTSMGAKSHEMRVVHQLQEFVHRYATDLLIDAQEYSTYADKTALDADDIRLAISSRMNQSQAPIPSRELMMELAHKRNCVPLPAISNEYGVRLPPVDHQLLTVESDSHDPPSQSTTSVGNGAATNKTQSIQSSHPPTASGNRNQKVSKNSIPINIKPTAN